MKKQQLLIALALIMGTVLPLTFFSFQSNNQNSTFMPNINEETQIETAAPTPSGYSNEIDMNDVYVYNVSTFGDTWNWYNYDDNVSSNYDVWQKWATGSRGQVKVNFTGFYNRHVNDTPWSPPQFPDENMPYMDLEIIEAGGSENLTRDNCSNSEIANNMNINFLNFDSGILIPKNNLTQVKQWANETANTNDLIFSIEESYHFIQFNFANIYQTSELVYNKFTGLLISINTTLDVGSIYHLDMYLTNFTSKFNEFNEQYIYNVNQYCHGEQYATQWNNLSYSYVDIWMTDQEGTFKVNFTGRYNKDAGDSWPDIFDANLKRPWLDIEIHHSYAGLILSLTNISNREAATNLVFGYNDWNSSEGFNPGFLLPSINNITDLKMKANQSLPIGDQLTIEESNLTIRFKYAQNSGLNQKTDLIYEKRTGLLLTAISEYDPNYQLNVTIEGFEYQAEQPTTSKDLDLLVIAATQPSETDSIPAYPLATILLIISFTLIAATILNKKKLSLSLNNRI
jgi:hypothetical protein